MMLIDVHVPKFGMSATHVEILEILVAVGDVVADGQPVAEAASDKVDFQLEADSGGRVAEILVSTGDSCEMGAVVMRLEPLPSGLPAGGNDPRQ